METHPNLNSPVTGDVTSPDKRVSKMCRNDRSMIVFWIFFMWIILGAVYWQVNSLAETPTVRVVALIAGVLVGLFNTAALLAVSGHLKRRKDILYAEDLSNLQKMQGGDAKKWSFVKIFDVLFILILCYLSLLTPILMRGKVLVGGGEGGGMLYTFTWPSLILCLVVACIFGYFLLTHSEKELKLLINNVYRKKGEQ